MFFGLDDEYYDLLSVNKAILYMKNHKLITISDCEHNFLKNRGIFLNKLITEINNI